MEDTRFIPTKDFFNNLTIKRRGGGGGKTSKTKMVKEGEAVG